ncbi:hypothetical protein [Streptomyces sp. NPDC004528]|uniref:hypothetical protein n=1 Tax=Streptomyces sp. NPDC004528 TaxID=3154550 RepID=UPI0033A9C834
MSVNKFDEVAPATHESVRREDGRGLVLRLSVTFDMDGACLSQALYEEFAHSIDNDEALPENLTVEDVMKILAKKHASCAEGWHIWSQEPSHESHEAALKFSDETIHRLFPQLTWRADEELSEPENPLSEREECDRMAKHLVGLGIKAESVSTGGGCWAVHYRLDDQHQMWVTPWPDWAYSIDRDGEQILAGDFEVSDIPDAAKRVKKLIKGLGTITA